MPIEFRCPSCTKLLRTPDESAGKKAKCPQCGNIVDVPTDTAGGTADAPSSGFSDPTPTAGTGSTEDTPDPFSSGPVSPFGTAGQAGGPENPYASPSAMSKDFESGSPSGDLNRRKLSFDEVFRTTWDIFTSNIGQCVLVGLIVLGISIGLGVVNQIVAMAAQASRELIAVIVANLFSQVLGLVVNVWLQMGLIYFAIRFARSGQPNVSDFFAIGPFYVKGLLATFLLQLLLVGILAICAIPGLIMFFVAGGVPAFQNDPTPVFIAGGAGLLIYVLLAMWIYLRLFLYFAFLVDRNVGVIESFSQSSYFMQGNKLTGFLLLLVATFVGGLFLCVTCGIGVLFFYPYLAILGAVFYLLATGQPLNNPKAYVQR